ncbi:MAG: phage recombination protein Bet [Hyphomonadaceae bacterium]|nr:phage recombination protein Bet [Hyphomonadaceae bacterium]
MSNVVALQPQRAVRDYSPSQLALIRNTVAKDTTADEFDMFVEVCKRVGLDPFRRQIYCVVYNKDVPDKRRVVFITAIDGFRAVAARNRDYRPDDQETQFEIDQSLVGPDNPRGLVKAVVRAYKLAANGEWHPVVGTAYWSEFAPMKEDGTEGFEWVESGQFWPADHPTKAGKPKMRKKALGESIRQPSGKWGEMPFVMLAKVAEAQALRKGWPEDLSGVYSPEELEGMQIDESPTALIEQHQTQKRLERVHATNAVPILWKAGEPIEYVPVGQMADRALAFIKEAESVVQLEWWTDTNVGGLREFWALAPTDALGVKKAREARLAALAE